MGGDVGVDEEESGFVDESVYHPLPWYHFSRSVQQVHGHLLLPSIKDLHVILPKPPPSSSPLPLHCRLFLPQRRSGAQPLFKKCKYRGM